MLTWSNWYTEPRSNRYHYATRFAKSVPVLFVQPTDGQIDLSCVRLADHNIYIVKVSSSYDSRTHRQIGRALFQLGLKNPLVWSYNGFFFETVRKISSPIKIYHATEDYFCADFNGSASVRDVVLQTIQACDAIVAVSDGVKDSYEKATNFEIPTIAITNGVDYEFWHKSRKGPPSLNPTKVVYQGGLNRKIDIELLESAILSNRNFEFIFCGKVTEHHDKFEKLFRMPNVKHLGELKPAELRQVVHACDIGIMPFVQNDWIVRRSFPLKAFEYLAAGLPVVSTPIDSLQKIGAPIIWCETSLQFSESLKIAAGRVNDFEYLAMIADSASAQDYDKKFESLLTFLANLKVSRSCPESAAIVIGSEDLFVPDLINGNTELYYFVYTPKILIPDALMLIADVVLISSDIYESLEPNNPMQLWLKEYPGRVIPFNPMRGSFSLGRRRSESDFYFGDGLFGNTASARLPIHLFRFKNTKYEGSTRLNVLSQIEGPFPVLDFYRMFTDPVHVLSTASKVFSIRALIFMGLGAPIAAGRRLVSKLVVLFKTLKKNTSGENQS